MARTRRRRDKSDQAAKCPLRYGVAMNADPSQQVEQAITTLKSFRNGDLGVACAIACGDEAVPALRDVLVQREPSGLFQARCRAVEALAALGAHDVLIEFLEIHRHTIDPIEQLGEDAVINAAALALANVRDEHVFELLQRLAQRPSLTGVIGALGAFGRVEAIPALVAALADDASRPTAESALRKLRRRARAALIAVAIGRPPRGERESETQARQRRSALRLLAEMGGLRDTWPSLRSLVQDTDAKIVVLACEICFRSAPAAQWRGCADRLIRLLAQGDWMLRQEIEDCLAAHFDQTREAIEDYLDANAVPSFEGDRRKADQTETALRRVLACLRAAP